jgi:DNA-binding beta-propeller fold protein YncE
MNARRSTLKTIAAWLCALTGCLLFWGASAQASAIHVFDGSFGSTGSGSGQFNEPIGIAVNETTHDVYVVDSVNNRVEELNSSGSTVLGEFDGSGAPSGTFLEPTQIAVDNSDDPLDPSAGDVYVVDQGHGVIDKFTSSGTYIGQLTGTPSGTFAKGSLGVQGIAVDPAGTLWVTESGNGNFYSFGDTLTNEYLSTLADPAGVDFGPAFGVDSEGNFYIEDNKISSSGQYLALAEDQETFGENAGYFSTDGIAVDSADGKVYDLRENMIFEYTLDGVALEQFGEGHVTNSSRGIAVDDSNGSVYVTDRSADDVRIFDLVSRPTVSTSAVTEQLPTSLTLNGKVNPEGAPLTSCRFEYVAASEYEPGAPNPYAKGTSVPCAPEAGSLGEGTVGVSVRARVEGLTAETTYHYRLVAANASGDSSTPDEELVAGPVLGGEYVSEVASTSATLQAQIDPNGGDTHYYFQYGTTTSYGTDAPISAPGADIGSVVAQQTVRLHLQNLEAGVLYHYRFVAVQDGEAFEEPDHTFTTQVAGGQELSLPDGRAWELVSPPDKKGALIGPMVRSEEPDQTAVNGGAIAYQASEPVGEGTVGHFVSAETLSTRGTNGWTSQDVAGRDSLPAEGKLASEVAFGSGNWQVFSSDLSLALYEAGSGLSAPPPPQSPEATERTLYLRNSANGKFLALETQEDVPSGTKFNDIKMRFLAGTPDLSHVIFGSSIALTPEALEPPPESSGYQNLYEWSAGRLQLVNIMPDTPESSTGTTEPGAHLGSFVNGAQGMTARAISADGRWVVWAPGELTAQTTSPVGLYVRDMVEEETYKLGGDYPRFETMSSDGSKIFFTETEGGRGGDLYVFDTTTGVSTDLTTNHGAGKASAGVQDAVMGASEDGSYVYFVATGVLATGGVQGADNVYVLHDTASGWTTTFIATLSGEDSKDWRGTQNETPSAESNIPPELPLVSSRVSPNGHYLAFMSEKPLTGYDNLDAVSGQPDEEVYLYDAALNRLVCTSCDPTGARPVGIFDDRVHTNALFADLETAWSHVQGNGNHWLAGSVPGWEPSEFGVASYQPRYLSDSGRLFFDSPDALVPQDTNGLEDVYEYEPVASGETVASDDCTTSSMTFSERSGGCVSLISSGQSASESIFIDASENGDDVFFDTNSRLTGEDYDTSYDVYDAHVCSSKAPCRAEPVVPPPCTSGDSCKPAPSPQPEIFGSAPSATFSGAGNVVEEAKPSVVKRKAKAKPKPKPKKHAKRKKRKAKKARRARSGRTNGKAGR